MYDEQKNNQASTDNTASETGQGTSAPVAPSDDNAGAPVVNDVASLLAEESIKIDDGVSAPEGVSAIPAAAPEANTVAASVKPPEPEDAVRDETPSADAGNAPQPEDTAKIYPEPLPERAAGTVIERVVERTVPAEITESDKDKIFTDRLRTMAPAAISAKQRKHEERLQAIITHLRQHGYITNDEVERLCRVANSTAAKYLTEFKKRGLLMQLGITGRKVRYHLHEAIP